MQTPRPFVQHFRWDVDNPGVCVYETWAILPDRLHFRLHVYRCIQDVSIRFNCVFLKSVCSIGIVCLVFLFFRYEFLFVILREKCSTLQFVLHRYLVSDWGLISVVVALIFSKMYSSSWLSSTFRKYAQSFDTLLVRLIGRIDRRTCRL